MFETHIQRTDFLFPHNIIRAYAKTGYELENNYCYCFVEIVVVALETGGLEQSL